MLNKLKNKNIITFLDQAIVSGSNFIFSILLARTLGIDGYGYYSLVWLVVLFFSSIQLAGLISPMMSLGAKKSLAAQKNYYFIMLIIQFFYSVSAFILSFVFLKLIGTINNKWDLFDLSYFVSIFIFVFLIQDFLRRYFFVSDKAPVVLIMDIFAYPGSIGLIAYYSLHNDLTLYIIFSIMIGMYLVSTIIGLSQVRHYYFNKHYTNLVFKKNISFSKWLIYSSLLQWGTGNYFILLAGSLIGTSAVGAIKAMQNLIGIFHIVFLALENILPIKFSQTYHIQGRAGLKRLLEININYTWIIFIPTLIITSLFPSQIVSLIYGTEYIDHSYILTWFTVIYVFIYINMLYRYVLRSLEETKSIFTSYVASLVFSIITSYPLIIYTGLTGVMIGLLGIQLITLYVIHNNVKKVIN